MWGVYPCLDERVGGPAVAAVVVVVVVVVGSRRGARGVGCTRPGR